MHRTRTAAALALGTLVIAALFVNPAGAETEGPNRCDDAVPVTAGDVQIYVGGTCDTGVPADSGGTTDVRGADAEAPEPALASNERALSFTGGDVGVLMLFALAALSLGALLIRQSRES